MSEPKLRETPPWKGWRDDPINTVDEDRLRRAPVAYRAAELIAENHTEESSVVYGLEGPWGSGKSSVIALLTNYLSRMGAGRWQVVPFTPWATTGTDGLLSEFFAALSTVAPSKNGHYIRQLIAKYADVARPLASLIPVAGSALVETSRSIEDRLAKPWNVVFDELAKALRDLDTPVLVVVDDIDRLQPRELFDLLRIVRLLGRFPGVDFLLAYDERTLVETLQRTDGGAASKTRARAFMEKIVQYPLSMPPLLLSQIIQMLDEGLMNIVTPHQGDNTFDRDRFGPIILKTMPAQMSTPRAIERYLAQVREAFRAHDPSEINAVDLILATFLRVQFPDVFARLQFHKTDLTRRNAVTPSWNADRGNSPDWNSLVDAIETPDGQADALAVLGAIFPAVRGNYSPTVEAGRFAHPEYFDRYIAQSIPEGDIPDALISRALTSAAVGDDHALRELLKSAHEDQVTLALSKILARCPDVNVSELGDAATAPFNTVMLATVMTLIDEAEDKSVSWTSHADQLRLWAAILLKRILHATPSEPVDAALLKCGNIARRAHVLATATRDIANLRPETRVAMQGALDRETERVAQFLKSELEKRDSAMEQSGSGFLYELVSDSPSANVLQQNIQAGLAARQFTIEDVAARFVGFTYLVGGPSTPSKAYFSGELFTRFTGIPAQSTKIGEEIDWSASSWADRRKFAKQFIAPSGRSTE